MFDSLKSIEGSVSVLKSKQLGNEQQRVLKAVAVIIDYMVKDSSIT